MKGLLQVKGWAVCVLLIAHEAVTVASSIQAIQDTRAVLDSVPVVHPFSDSSAPVASAPRVLEASSVDQPLVANSVPAAADTASNVASNVPAPTALTSPDTVTNGLADPKLLEDISNLRASLVPATEPETAPNTHARPLSLGLTTGVQVLEDSASSEKVLNGAGMEGLTIASVALTFWSEFTPILLNSYEPFKFMDFVRYFSFFLYALWAVSHLIPSDLDVANKESPGAVKTIFAIVLALALIHIAASLYGYGSRFAKFEEKTHAPDLASAAKGPVKKDDKGVDKLPGLSDPPKTATGTFRHILDIFWPGKVSSEWFEAPRVDKKMAVTRVLVGAGISMMLALWPKIQEQSGAKRPMALIMFAMILILCMWLFVIWTRRGKYAIQNKVESDSVVANILVSVPDIVDSKLERSFPGVDHHLWYQLFTAAPEYSRAFGEKTFMCILLQFQSKTRATPEIGDSYDKVLQEIIEGIKQCNNLDDSPTTENSSDQPSSSASTLDKKDQIDSSADASQLAAPKHSPPSEPVAAQKKKTKRQA